MIIPSLLFVNGAEDGMKKIGYELALKFTKGNHGFIVATHIDKSHIHNHIIYNSTFLDCTKKFRDFLGSGKAVRKISDCLCLENGLSIIENPERGKTIMANGSDIKILLPIRRFGENSVREF